MSLRQSGGMMASLDAVIQQLREELKQTQSQLEGLDRAISALEDSSGTNSASRRSSRRTMSAAGRRRIAEAQKLRWAKLKATNRKRRTISPAARARIVAAQKARWAKLRAQKKK